MLRGGALVGYLDAGASLGAGLLLSRAGRAELDVSGAEIRLISCSCDIEPLWDGEKLRALRISLSVSGSLTESRRRRGPLAGGGKGGAWKRHSPRSALAWRSSAWPPRRRWKRTSSAWARSWRRREPRRWREISGGWDALLPQLELHVEAEATLLRSYGYDDPPTRGKGG